MAETEALVQRYLDAFSAGDSEAMLACLSEDVVHEINQGGVEKGKAAFRAFNAVMAEHYTEQLRDIEILCNANGDRAAAEFVVEGTYRKTAEDLPEATGQTYTLSAGIFFEVRQSLICRVTTYYNLANWIALVRSD